MFSMSWLLSLLPPTLCSNDLQSVRMTVLLGSCSVVFRVLVASMSAKASALKLVDIFPVGTLLDMRLPSGNCMYIPAPPSLTASFAEPSV